MNDAYKVIDKFDCCGVDMVTVIINKKAVCVMTEIEFDRMIKAERKYCKRNHTRVA